MNTLIIFIKYPEAGKVKTRLAKDIGDTEASEIYSQMTKKIIDESIDTENYSTIIFYDPPDKEYEVKNWIEKKELQYIPQQGDSLGEKISSAFNEVYSLGADNTVIIGSDCIDVNKEIINEAMEALENVDIVLGPAEDGGYYLLGLNKYTPEIFQDIQWSTEQVLEQTIERINNKCLKYELLKTLKDVDTVDDLYASNIDFAGIVDTKV